MKNYYKILGISNTADYSAIKKAYRKLALKYHPDINKSPDAATKFIEIKEAYDTLIDKHSRTSYDWALKVYYNSLHTNKRSSQQFGYGGNPAEEEKYSKPHTHTTVNNNTGAKEKDTKYPSWIIWGMFWLLGAFNQATKPKTASYATQNLYSDEKPFYVHDKKPANSIFVNGTTESKQTVNSSPAAISKNQASRQENIENKK